MIVAPPTEPTAPGKTDDPTVISARGDLDAIAGAELRVELRSALSASLVILDLWQIDAIDPPAVGALIGFVRDVHERGGQTVIVSRPGAVFGFLDRVGITRLVPVLTSFDDAKDHLCVSCDMAGM